MITKELIEKIEKAPPQIQKEVQDFLDFLLKKETQAKNEVEPQKQVRKAGFAKGTFTYIADDFDEPMELVDSKELDRLRKIASEQENLNTY